MRLTIDTPSMRTTLDSKGTCKIIEFPIERTQAGSSAR